MRNSREDNSRNTRREYALYFVCKDDKRIKNAEIKLSRRMDLDREKERERVREWDMKFYPR